MRILANIREFVARQVRGLGSLVSASVIVLAVLAFAVYSANAGSGQDRMRRAAEDAARSAKAAIAAAGRVSQLYISADGLDRPVSYMALIRIHGWKNREQRVIDASVDTVRALDGGEVNATAVSSGSVADAIADQITGKRVLASVDPRIAADMPEDGDAQVRLIVSPNGATATLVIDEVIEPIQLKGAGMAPAGTTVRVAGSSASPSPAGAPSAVGAQPRIRSLSAYVAGPGKIVTIYGSDFGSAMGTGRVNCAGARAAVTSWSDTSISFKVPSGISRAGYVGVVVKGVASNGVYFSPFSAPVVTSISPQQGAPGTLVTISGRNFGSERAGWVTFAGSSATVMSWTDQAIQVLVPRGVGAGYAGVIAHGMTSNGVLYAPYGAPLVTSVSKRFFGPGDTVTLRGAHFGSAPGLVALGGALISASEWKPGSVTFTVPETVKSGYVGVVLKSGVTSNGVWRSVTPKMESISTWWAAPGTKITLHGRGFGDGGAYTVYVGGVPATVESWSRTAIVARVPNASSGYVGVGTPAACSNGIFLLIDKPGKVTDVTPRSVQRGGQLTITGSGFGTSQGRSRVLLGGMSCVVQPGSWSDGSVVVAVPASARSGYVGITDDHVTSNGVWVNVQP